VKRTPILLSDAADDDLNELAYHIASSQDLVTGDRFVDAVQEPWIFWRDIRVWAEVEEPCDSRAADPANQGFSYHLACHRITKRGIEILRLVHGARDYQRLFED
jgi:plasmid stabilization system protein ParE